MVQPRQSQPLMTVSIVLKILQIVSLTAGTGIVGYFVKEFHDYRTINDPLIDPYDLGEFGRYEFFLYSNCVGVAIAGLGLLFVCTRLLEKKRGAFAMAFLQVFSTLQLAVSTALLTKLLLTYKKEVEQDLTTISLCDFWDKADEDFQCTHLTGGVACGFSAALLFALDAIISFISYKSS